MKVSDHQKRIAGKVKPTAKAGRKLLRAYIKLKRAEQVQHGRTKRFPDKSFDKVKPADPVRVPSKYNRAQLDQN